MSSDLLPRCIDFLIWALLSGATWAFTDYLTSLPYSSTTLPHPSSPTRPESPTPTDTSSEGSLTAVRLWTGEVPEVTTGNRCRYQVTSTDKLPDDVLLPIFEFCADEEQSTKKQIEAWQSLAHVCRQWRSVVFESPRRLNLRLVCTPGTPAKDTLDVWPALPLLIRGEDLDTSSMNNIMAVLARRRSRVCQIKLVGLQSSQLEEVSAAMQEPFLELMHLELWSNDETMPVLPDSFLGGFVPDLRFLWLAGVPVPSLPKLLLSATHLVDLHLVGIPHSGYVSPEAMVTALSTLTSLDSLSLKFQSPLSYPDGRSQRPPPPTPFALPVLTYLWFKGASEYLDDLVARIDAPQLEYLNICFFNQLIFNTPEFVKFVGRTPTLNAPEKARVSFERGAARVSLSSETSQTSGYGELVVEISCTAPDWQLSSLGQVCNSCLPRLSKLESLCIFEHQSLQTDWQDNIENTQWTEVFYPFTNVKNLYLSEVFAPRIAPALQEPLRSLDKIKDGLPALQFIADTSSITDALPTLRNIFLEGLQPSEPIQKAIGEFVSSREVTGHLIAVSPWDRRSRF